MRSLLVQTIRMKNKKARRSELDRFRNYKIGGLLRDRRFVKGAASFSLHGLICRAKIIAPAPVDAFNTPSVGSRT